VNWIQDLLQPAVTTGIWAFMLYRLGRHVAGKFDESIGKTLHRLKKLGPAEFEPPSQPLKIETSNPPAELPAAVDSLPQRFEAPIREWLNLLPPDQHEAELVRALVAWQMAWGYEVVNFHVFGSQIALLQALNSQSLTLDRARLFYQEAAAQLPDFYSDYSFEAWLAWLRDTAELIANLDHGVSITEHGREFLKYLIHRGYAVARPG
jgi:hypothetical protein